MLRLYADVYKKEGSKVWLKIADLSELHPGIRHWDLRTKEAPFSRSLSAFCVWMRYPHQMWCSVAVNEQMDDDEQMWFSAKEHEHAVQCTKTKQFFWQRHELEKVFRRVAPKRSKSRLP